MSGDPSPFKFFIDNRLLTAVCCWLHCSVLSPIIVELLIVQDNFQIQAFERYGDHASKFCDELVETFHQVSNP